MTFHAMTPQYRILLAAWFKRWVWPALSAITSWALERRGQVSTTDKQVLSINEILRTTLASPN